MSRDYAALERELIEELETRTGRDLAQWMAAIDAAALPARNDIIDWLRPQGFSFSRASWLERIHHNGGRPVYAATRDPRAERPRLRAEDAAPPRPATPAPAPSALPTPAESGHEIPPSSPPPLPPPPPSMAPAPATPPPTPAAPPPDDAAAIAALLGKAKAYRMLAELVLCEARQAMPRVSFAVEGDVILMTGQRLAGALLIGPRELRLGLDLGAQAVDPPWVKPKPPLPRPLTHMLVLTDARQIDAALRTSLAAAATRANAA